jgi:TonB family protein
MQMKQQQAGVFQHRAAVAGWLGGLGFFGLVATALPVQAQIQGVAAPSDKVTMERAQREADGPRRRILEAAKVKGVVRGNEPAAAAPAAVAAVAAPVAPQPPAQEPARALSVLQPSVAPVALPSAQEVALAPASVVPVQLAPSSMAVLAALPSTQSMAPPKLLSKVEPEFTPRLMRRLTRRVELRVEVGIETDGRVRDVQVAQGGNEELAQAVRDAMLQWRYEAQPAPRRHLVELVIDPN